MSLLTLVLPLALLLAVFWLVVFGWSARSGQLDDLDSPAVRMLHDDEAPQAPKGRGSSSS